MSVKRQCHKSDDVVDEFGAILDCNEMSMELTTTLWSEQGVKGCYRFIEKGMETSGTGY